MSAALDDHQLALRILEDAAVLVLVVDFEGRIVHVNRCFERVTGHRLDELRGEDFFATCSPEQGRDRARALLVERAAGTRGRTSVSAILTRTGEEGQVEWTEDLLHDGEGKPIGIVSVGRVVTEPASEPRASATPPGRSTRPPADRTLLRAIIDAFPGLVGLYTAEGDFVDANAASYARTGRLRGEPVDQKIWDLPQYSSTPERREQVRDAMARVNRGESVRFDWRFPMPGGETFDVDASFCPIRDDAGRVTHVAAFGVDVTARNRALVELGETEARLAETLASISDAFIMIDTRDWTLRYMNPAAARLVDRTVEQLIGKRIWDEFPESVDSPFARGYRRVAAERVPATVEGHYAPLDVWLRARIFPTDRGLAVYYSDISAQKRAEMAVERSEALFRNVMEQASDAIFITDTDARYLEVNVAACELVGYGRDELLGRSARDMLVAPLGDGPDAVDELRGRTPSCHDWKMRQKNGAVLDVEASIKLLSDGRVLHVVRDVTASKLAADLLARSELRFRQLVELSPNWIVIVDRSRAIRYMNHDPISVAGFTRTECLGIPFETFVHESSRSRVAEIVDAVFESGSAARWEGGSADSERSLRAQIVPLPPDERDSAQVLIVVEDATEERRAAEQREIMLAELDHRVKNTLATVVAISEQTLARAPSLEAFRDTFSGRLSSLARTHDALAASRWTSVDLGRLWDLVVLPLSCGASGLAEGSENPALSPRVVTPLALVLHELATNSMKYGAWSTPDGSVACSASGAAARVLALRWHERATASPRPAREGLGLRLVRGLVERELGGSMSLELLDDGRRYDFRIPLE